MKKKIIFQENLFVLIILSFLILGIIFNQIPSGSSRLMLYFRHYYFLSKSFLAGKLDVTDELKKNFTTASEFKQVFDYAIFNNKYFLHLGVFPAIVGIPFLIFGPEKFDTAMVIFFLILSIIFLLKLTNRFLKIRPLTTTLLIIFGSPVLTSLVWRGPWYLSALVSFSLGLLFLWFYSVKRKDWSIFLISILTLTRPTNFFYFLIPLFDVLGSWHKNKKRKVFLFTAVGLTLTILFAYNYFRFGNPLETGYKFVRLPEEEFRKFREETNFDFRFVLSNSIYFFLNPPKPYLDKALRFTFPYFELSRYGVGLLYSMPWLLLSFCFLKSKHQNWSYLISISLILFVILLFRGEGSFQIGPRYACDLLPLFLFVNFNWLSVKRDKIPLFQKIVLISFFLNLYFLFLVHLGHIRRI